MANESLDLNGSTANSSMSTEFRKTWNPKYILKYVDSRLMTAIHTSDPYLRSHFDCVRCLRFHATEPLLITGSEDETLKLWNLNKTQQSNKGQSLEFGSAAHDLSALVYRQTAADGTDRWHDLRLGAGLHIQRSHLSSAVSLRQQQQHIQWRTERRAHDLDDPVQHRHYRPVRSLRLESPVMSNQCSHERHLVTGGRPSGECRLPSPPLFGSCGPNHQNLGHVSSTVR